MNKIYKNNPYIILGVHRSGTTLMSKLFAKAGIFTGINQNINKEATFFFNINKKLLKENDSDAYFFENTLKNLKNEEYLNKKSKQLKKIINKDIYLKFFGIKHSLQYFLTGKLPEWGFKDPRTVIFLPLWSKVFPDAKYLIILRNPIDVCMSIYYFEQKRWLQKIKKRPDSEFNMHLLTAFEVWKNFTKLLTETPAEYPKQSLLIKYENLKEEKTLKKIINFLNSGIKPETLQKIIKNKTSNYEKPEDYENFIKIVKNDDFVKQIYPEII
ncbi:MAG: sulfotransferase [Chlorobi bacterium]|nr:sulfotransferase [Chlorobiota bacterium]